jgi:tetratricopeptide (TPR) repeat protein
MKCVRTLKLFGSAFLVLGLLTFAALPTAGFAQQTPSAPSAEEITALDELTAGLSGGGMAALEAGIRFGVGEEENGPAAPTRAVMLGAVYFLDLADAAKRQPLALALAVLITDYGLKPDNDPDGQAVALLSRAGQVLYEGKDYSNAVRAYSKSAAILETLVDPNSPDLAAARYTSGLALLKSGNAKGAEAPLKAAYLVLMQQRPEQDGLLKPVAKAYSDALRALNRLADAEKITVLD